MNIHVESIRNDFPALHQTIYGKPLVYMDNAGTALKPKSVLDSLFRYYSLETANVHRGLYLLSEKATAAYENARANVKQFLNAS